MKLAVVLLSLLINIHLTKADPVEILRIPVSTYTDFEIDHLGNIYVILNDELVKYDLYGQKLSSFTNKDLGKISSIDVTNPLRIMVFYKVPSKIIWLDNSLAMVGDIISLGESSFGPIDLVCNTRSRGFWGFTTNNFQLMLLDNELNKINVTSNLDRVSNSNLSPNFIKEGNGKVLLNNPESGVLIFEQYGGFLETIPIKNLEYFQVNKNGFYYLSNNNFNLYNFASKKSELVFSPKETVSKVLIKGSFLYQGTENEIVIVKI